MTPAMHINIVTLFPEFFAGPLTCALMQRARDAGLISFSLHNPRDMAEDRHRTVDDRPYGGGPGMVMLPGPVAKTLRSLGHRPRGEPQPGRLLFLSPKGTVFSQPLAREFAGHAAEPGKPAPGSASILTLLCGRYEGLDARIEEMFPVEAVSVGDFVLNGGEAAALCVIEAIVRLLPGFMGHEDSGQEESFSAGLLEYPHYTRPEEFEGRLVPDILRSGDHGRIALWRRQASLLQTLEARPELLGTAALSEADGAFLQSLNHERPGRNLYCALVHYPVLDKAKNSVTVSLTNLDIHDIARSSCTYGLGGYYVLTPLDDQRELLQSILAHWREGPGRRGNPDRDTALSLVRSGTAISDAVADITNTTGQEPLVIGTSARPEADGPPIAGFDVIARMLRHKPVLLLFGTGHGLSPEVHTLCHAFAPPLRRYGGYNHLSVRSAAAIILDRILGDWR
jgi:tRNA (guanine37-N1)-methyltransferase